jgi:hypothetical protein
METLLMPFGSDPLSALIGGGLGLIGSAMNTSSMQSINAANLQQQTWSAEGGYLPGLVQNANAAGLNPLAVLGSRGPNMAVQVGTQPGAGLQEMGKEVASMDMQRQELDLQLRREQIQQTAAQTMQTNVDRARNQWLLEQWQSGKFVPPGMEPAAETSIPGAFIKGGQNVLDAGKNFFNGLNFDQWRKNAFNSMAVPPIFQYGGRFYDYLQK